jgi:PLP dependent protein
MSGSNFKLIQEAIERAGGKNRVALVGVAKQQPEEKVREAVQAGLKIVANNYVQEGERLRGSLGALSVEWHFIGHIQSRKAKDLTSYACVQSLDRLKVAEALNEKMGLLGRKLPVLIEVNVGEEAQKSGVSPGEIEPLLTSVAALPFLEIRGIMGMPPPVLPVEKRRPFFRTLRQVFESSKFSSSITVLSMGTSDDYLVAIDEGSTMVRLGTVLFGGRDLSSSRKLW